MPTHIFQSHQKTLVVKKYWGLMSIGFSAHVLIVSIRAIGEVFQRIKFLVGFIQFSRSFVTALILLSTHNLCTALDGSADDSKQAYTGFALEALQRSQSNSLPTHASDIEAITANKPSSELTEQAESLKKIIPSAEQNSVAKSISDQTSKNVLNTLNSPNTILDKLVSTNAYTRPPIQRPKSVQHVQLLISWSMTELDINSALSLASQDQDILVVMKGFIDSDIKTALTRLQNRVSKFHPVPNVVIDPKPFRFIKFLQRQRLYTLRIRQHLVVLIKSRAFSIPLG